MLKKQTNKNNNFSLKRQSNWVSCGFFFFVTSDNRRTPVSQTMPEQRREVPNGLAQAWTRQTWPALLRPEPLGSSPPLCVARFFQSELLSSSTELFSVRTSGGRVCWYVAEPALKVSRPLRTLGTLRHPSLSVCIGRQRGCVSVHSLR